MTSFVRTLLDRMPKSARRNEAIDGEMRMAKKQKKEEKKKRRSKGDAGL